MFCAGVSGAGHVIFLDLFYLRLSGPRGGGGWRRGLESWHLRGGAQVLRLCGLERALVP